MQKMSKTIGFLLKLSRRETTIVNCQLSIVNCQFGEAANFQFVASKNDTERRREKPIRIASLCPVAADLAVSGRSGGALL